MQNEYRDTPAHVLAELFCAAEQAGRDTFEFREAIEERSWLEKAVWNKVLETEAKKKELVP